MRELSSFSLRIPDINNRPSSELIPIFAYYLQEVEAIDCITASNVAKCFDELSIKAYSNIPAYLRKKATTKPILFIKRKNGYILTKQAKESLSSELSMPVDIMVSNTFIDLSLFENTPYYIKGNAKQMAQCYECNLCDATLVLMRKLMETLIIESFERFGIDYDIKGSNGDFLYLSDLIPKYLSSPKWNVSRNLEKNIPKVKKYGDLSAHNRRFQAKKSDIDEFKFELRQTIQEIILTIDYPNWDREKNTR